MISLFIGIIVFLLVQMLILKSFKVIKRKVIKEIGCFTVFMVVLFGGLYLNAVRLTNIIRKNRDRGVVCDHTEQRRHQAVANIGAGHLNPNDRL